MKKLSLGILVFSLAAPFALADLAALKARVPKIVELKEKGLVGEQRDGLLGIVKKDADAEKVVSEENKDRLKVYEERSNDQGVDLPTLQKVLGDAKIREEKSGRFIQDEKGAWVKK